MVIQLKSLDRREGLSLSGIAHGRDHARFDAPFSDQQVAMEAVDYINQLADVTKLRYTQHTFDHNGTGRIFERHQTLAEHAGWTQGCLIRCQGFT
ncbi:MAG: hypothetical protein JWP80_1632 [Pseudomonas sp.]|nr:hypothetical protein [Pseudomonas sp.]